MSAGTDKNLPAAWAKRFLMPTKMYHPRKADLDAFKVQAEAHRTVVLEYCPPLKDVIDKLNNGTVKGNAS